MTGLIQVDPWTAPLINTCAGVHVRSRPQQTRFSSRAERGRQMEVCGWLTTDSCLSQHFLFSFTPLPLAVGASAQKVIKCCAGLKVLDIFLPRLIYFFIFLKRKMIGLVTSECPWKYCGIKFMSRKSHTTVRKKLLDSVPARQCKRLHRSEPESIFSPYTEQ